MPTRSCALALIRETFGERHPQAAAVQALLERLARMAAWLKQRAICASGIGAGSSDSAALRAC